MQRAVDALTVACANGRDADRADTRVVDVGGLVGAVHRDDGAIAYALSAWCDAHAGPRHSQLRLEAAAEMLAAARRADDPELELLARRFQIVALMELAGVVQASRTIDAFAQLADRLRQPQFCWYARLVEGMRALLRGDVAHGVGVEPLGEGVHRIAPAPEVGHCLAALTNAPQIALEGVRQMRGTSVNQVKDAATCVVSNQGGIMTTHSTLILGH